MHFIGCHTDLVMGVWGHITSQNAPKSLLPTVHKVVHFGHAVVKL